MLSDQSFVIDYFSDRLDSIALPLDWLSSEPNKRHSHLLDYAWLFPPTQRATYFRAINFSRMSQAHEKANQTHALIHRQAHRTLYTTAHFHMRLYDRLFMATTSFLVLEIRRSHVLEDTFNSLWRRQEREILRPLKVRLGEDAGEEGLDSGGVQQEFFRLAVAEALDPDYGKCGYVMRCLADYFRCLYD